MCSLTVICCFSTPMHSRECSLIPTGFWPIQTLCYHLEENIHYVKKVVSSHAVWLENTVGVFFFLFIFLQSRQQPAEVFISLCLLLPFFYLYCTKTAVTRTSIISSSVWSAERHKRKQRKQTQRNKTPGSGCRMGTLWICVYTELPARQQKCRCVSKKRNCCGPNFDNCDNTSHRKVCFYTHEIQRLKWVTICEDFKWEVWLNKMTHI